MYYENNIPDWNDNTIQMLGSFSTINIPDEISLLPAYPNPFNPSTQLQFTVPEDMNVALNVYDINGRLVDEIVNARFEKREASFVDKDLDFDSGAILQVLGNIFNNIVLELKEQGLITCLLVSLCEALKRIKEVQEAQSALEKVHDVYKSDSITVEAELISIQSNLMKI